MELGQTKRKINLKVKTRETSLAGKKTNIQKKELRQF